MTFLNGEQCSSVKPLAVRAARPALHDRGLQSHVTGSSVTAFGRHTGALPDSPPTGLKEGLEILFCAYN